MMTTSQELIDLAKKLITTPTVSGTKNDAGEYNENVLADFVSGYFKKHGIDTGFLPISDGRKCVYAFKKGSTKKTVVLLGHLDTVGVDDYEGVDAFRTDGTNPRFLYGRGSGDMKSALAVGMGLMKDLQAEELQTNIILIVTPDEEGGSSGVLAAGRFLQKLKHEQGLNYDGLINLSCALDDPRTNNRTVFAGGAVGKFLPCFYVVGRSGHANDPFLGIGSNAISSEIVQLLDSNVAYSTTHTQTGQLTTPPTCLRVVDIKDHYTVQLPIRSFVYFNYLTFDETPKQVLAKMVDAGTKALTQALATSRRKYNAYLKAGGKHSALREWDATANVYTYEEVEKRARKHHPNLDKEIAEVVAKTKGQDNRDRNVRVVSAVARYAQLSTPYVICFFSSPYYPASLASDNPFVDVVRQTVQQFGEEERIGYDIKDVCDIITDMNFMQINAESSLDRRAYASNNPLAIAEGLVDFDVITDISMPLSLIGAYALYPHRRNERVDIKYTFEVLPRLLRKVIAALQVG